MRARRALSTHAFPNHPPSGCFSSHNNELGSPHSTPFLSENLCYHVRLAERFTHNFKSDAVPTMQNLSPQRSLQKEFVAMQHTFPGPFWPIPTNRCCKPPIQRSLQNLQFVAKQGVCQNTTKEFACCLLKPMPPNSKAIYIAICCKACKRVCDHKRVASQACKRVCDHKRVESYPTICTSKTLQ